jgi:hypothetical protein
MYLQFWISLILCSVAEISTSSNLSIDDNELWNAITEWSRCTSIDAQCAFPTSRVLSDGSSLIMTKIPHPSGIVIEELMSPEGTLRSCRLDYSAVGLRPSWANVFTIPLFTADESLSFVRAAEEYGNQVGGWGQSHNSKDQLPSVDLPVRLVLQESNYLELVRYLESSIMNAIAQSFGLHRHLLRLRFY